MGDEVEFAVIQLKPRRYTKWHLLGLGLNFASDALDGLSGWFGTASLMVAQHAMQKDEDDQFKEIVSGS
jgi:hypothetical protein